MLMHLVRPRKRHAKQLLDRSPGQQQHACAQHRGSMRCGGCCGLVWVLRLWPCVSFARGHKLRTDAGAHVKVWSALGLRAVWLHAREPDLTVAVTHVGLSEFTSMTWPGLVVDDAQCCAPLAVASIQLLLQAVHLAFLLT